MLTDPPDDLRSALRERSLDRVNSRNGYRGRDFDTRAGTIELAVPKLRFGTYFPDWLLEPAWSSRCRWPPECGCGRPLDPGHFNR